VTKVPNWTPGRLASLKKQELEALLKNAAKQGASAIVALCEDELSSRKPAKRSPQNSSFAKNSGDYVAGYHFVCERDKGVRPDKDGTFWSGSWVVSKMNADKSLKYGAYVALHASKAESSYRLGKLIAFQVTERDMVDKDNLGIEFHLREMEGTREWFGGGSGEKGYLWASVSASLEPAHESEQNK
jgi:hypothetical protein